MTTYDIAALVKDINVVSFDLYHFLRKKSQGNLFYSPIDICRSFAILYTGARDNTANSMTTAFRVDLEKTAYHVAYRDLIQFLLLEERDVSFRIASRIWAKKDFIFDPLFEKIVSECYKVDFLNLEDSNIASWVSNVTGDTVTDVGYFGENRFILKNLVDYTGYWALPFHRDRTQQGVFYASNGTVVQTQFMNQTNEFRYFIGENVRLLILPYANPRFSFIAIQPLEEDIDELEDSFTEENLKMWIANAINQQVDVILPKFDFKMQVTGIPFVGMDNLFSPYDANFSGLTREPFWISSFIHHSSIEIDESGTSATTATDFSTMILEAGTEQFFADRPFIFLIRDESIGLILFMGRLVCPGSDQNIIQDSNDFGEILGMKHD